MECKPGVCACVMAVDKLIYLCVLICCELVFMLQAYVEWPFVAVDEIF